MALLGFSAPRVKRQRSRLQRKLNVSVVARSPLRKLRLLVALLGLLEMHIKIRWQAIGFLILNSHRLTNRKAFCIHFINLKC